MEDVVELVHRALDRQQQQQQSPSRRDLLELWHPQSQQSFPTFQQGMRQGYQEMANTTNLMNAATINGMTMGRRF